MRVFENRVLWMILVSEMVEVTGDWKRLRNEDPHDLYSATNISWVIKPRAVSWAWHVAHTGGKKRCIRGFGGVTEGQKPLRITRCRIGLY